MSQAHDDGASAVPWPTGDVDCSEIVFRLYQFIDAEMTTEEYVRFQAHLDHCPDCLSDYERDQLVRALVRRSCTRQSAPVQLRLQILARITRIEAAGARVGHVDGGARAESAPAPPRPRADDPAAAHEVRGEATG